eukprot:m.152650 g.152650  ORF g.152650 m.152650 type:complete len:330 (+) comp16363_c1_seq10:649-1638(+)
MVDPNAAVCVAEGDENAVVGVRGLADSRLEADFVVGQPSNVSGGQCLCGQKLEVGGQQSNLHVYSNSTVRYRMLTSRAVSCCVRELANQGSHGQQSIRHDGKLCLLRGDIIVTGHDVKAVRDITRLHGIGKREGDVLSDCPSSILAILQTRVQHAREARLFFHQFATQLNVVKVGLALLFGTTGGEGDLEALLCHGLRGGEVVVQLDELAGGQGNVSRSKRIRNKLSDAVVALQQNGCVNGKVMVLPLANLHGKSTARVQWNHSVGGLRSRCKRLEEQDLLPLWYRDIVVCCRGVKGASAGCCACKSQKSGFQVSGWKSDIDKHSLVLT